MAPRYVTGEDADRIAHQAERLVSGGENDSIQHKSCFPI